ncbi:MAG: circularly permuted type 2 ATP-grasp protein [Pseudomonadota bacterium]
MALIDPHDPPSQTAYAPWLKGYAPLRDVPDECVEADGTVKPAWREIVSEWTRRGGEARAARRAAADRYLRDSGVAHRVYGEGQALERPWPLSHVPLIIGADEWAALERGLIQRAHLLEAVISDLYGAQSLTRNGHIPAHLVGSSPGFVRPLAGYAPPSGYHLHTIAMELGRGPDGRWWVLGDRTQAPSGSGYALENRVAISRALGDDLSLIQVRTLGGYFERMREHLGYLRSEGSARVGLLTPGAFSQTYYEQALLARYLGLLLLEGGDLEVRDDQVYVRTVRGLKRLDVLWRRVDAAYCDPLELLSESRLGIPGLTRSVRAGHLTCVNSLGAGLLESRYFLAFLPALAKRLLGEDLVLPNIATWWLGDPAAASDASDAKSSVELSAVGTRLQIDGDALGEQEEAQGIPDHPAFKVRQEAVRLSTLPAREAPVDGDPNPMLTARPFSWRVFLMRNGNNWDVMPGGFARVSDGTDPRALSMNAGSRSADVWVRSHPDQTRGTSVVQTKPSEVRRVPGTLPSRAADNLYWLGRYTERAQLSGRLTRAYLDRRLHSRSENEPLLEQMVAQMGIWGVDEFSSDALFEQAVLNDLDRARNAASSIRDRFSPEAWQGLNRFVDDARHAPFTFLSTLERIDRALLMLSAFAGLISENMIRLSGWRFLEIGRRLERAMGTAQLANALVVGDPPPGGLDLMLELGDSVLSYRQRYSINTDPKTVADLIVLDPNNPRSIAFQLERIHLHIDEITDHRAFDQSSDLQKLAFSAWSVCHTASAELINPDLMQTITSSLDALAGSISVTFMTPQMDAKGGLSFN